MWMAFVLHKTRERGVIDCRGFYRKHGSQPALIALVERERAGGTYSGITTQMATTKRGALLNSARLV